MPAWVRLLNRPRTGRRSWPSWRRPAPAAGGGSSSAAPPGGARSASSLAACAWLGSRNQFDAMLAAPACGGSWDTLPKRERGMCGIAGYLAADAGVRVPGGLIDAMVDALTHRGPDERGVFCDGNVA